ncbi:MAG: threonylcarbamoyl-AMP synthase [Theionarchaea archaeon]|nr:threonylcarbamoyl-AMP synthase [Theionarchaea archaeon]MBU7037767.1 threonylcarbamoyl-AMP synthase [Theionarchaea archaeon]
METKTGPVVKTQVITVDRETPELYKIRIAAQVIREGGLVAFPTETVYGLGANTFDVRAVLRIFQAKNRPYDNPLIVHVSEKDAVYDLAREIPDSTEVLTKRFWPGPLTLLLKKAPHVPRPENIDEITVRMPDHNVALALIAESGVPISAPSANISGGVSPTTAQHVYQDLAGKIEVLLDGGPCDVGVESTVLDLTGEVPTILRPGGITLEDLRAVLGNVEVHPVAAAAAKTEAEARAPGMKYKHYSPHAEVIVVEGQVGPMVEKINQLLNQKIRQGLKVGVMATEETAHCYNQGLIKVVGSRRNLGTVARNLFDVLRAFDEQGVDIIIAEGVVTAEIGLAIMNRLRKSAGFNIVRV